MDSNVIWTPQAKQFEFMQRPEDEALYGGAAGGGTYGIKRDGFDGQIEVDWKIGEEGR